MSDEITNKLTQIESLLDDCKNRISDIQGLLLVSREGLPIAASLSTSEDTDEDRLSAMTAAALNLAERVVVELDKGNLREMTVKGDAGLVIIIHVGEQAVLTGTTLSEARLGLILLEMKRTAKSISKILIE
ncbi:MAG: roadblock/LC7 domain-containing protein [Candidatus Hodarchaeales archaeon]